MSKKNTYKDAVNEISKKKFGEKIQCTEVLSLIEFLSYDRELLREAMSEVDEALLKLSAKHNKNAKRIEKLEKLIIKK